VQGTGAGDVRSRRRLSVSRGAWSSANPWWWPRGSALVVTRWSLWTPATRPSQQTPGMKPLETRSAVWPPRWSTIRRARNAYPQCVAAGRAPTSW